MRRALIELYRTAHQVSAIPARLMRSLDESVSVGDDELSLADVITDDPDPESTMVTKMEAIGAAGRIADAQFAKLGRMMEGICEEAAERLAISVRTFAAEVLGPDDYASLNELLKGDQLQELLFSLAPERGSDQAADLARSVYEGYAALQWLVLVDLAEGYTYEDIASRMTIRFRAKYPGIVVSQELVAQIVGALKETAGVTDDLEPVAA
jgi:hypothetical protein